MSEKKPFQRLPTSVVPLVYDLTLKPDLSKFTFEGKEKIDIEVKEETQTITLNVNEIVIAAEGLTVAYPNKSKICRQIPLLTYPFSPVAFFSLPNSHWSGED